MKTLSDNKLSNWDKKVAIISRKQPFIVPDVGDEILAKVYDGVLNEKQLSVCYQPKDSSEKNYNIHPLGIVMVDEVIYLVGTIWKYTDIRQFALHRFISVDNTEEDIITVEGFDLRKYQQSGNFGFPVDENKKEIELEMMVAHWVADFLNEQALSINQKIVETEPESPRPYKVTATVLNTAQLRWWLSHFVVNVEIIGPVSLREEFKENAKSLGKLYKGYK
ncbi:helix-turn-helix transcriptional regulator [Psychromonas sp. KJ10-10]|uniref:helix-turn-helix transcriptional regulator n=1 Tax=Psychromonas sp. KJ10-10 TaxID=3391823 RepID=UPI0039B62DC8